MLVSRIQKTANSKEPVVQEVYRKRYAHIKAISEILDRYEELPQDIEGTTEQVQVRNRSADTLFGINLNRLTAQPQSHEVVNTYLLQSRPAPVMAKRRMYNFIIKDEIPSGEGIAVSGGGIAGRAVDAMGKTDEEFEKEVNDLREWMDKNGEQHLGIIMLINYTAPEEVHKIEMKNIDGILSFAVTSSHAALTARREGKACIGQIKGLTYSGGEWRLNSQRIFLGIPEMTSFKFNPEIGIISMNAHLPTVDRKNSGNIYLNKKLDMEPLDYHNNFPQLPDNLYEGNNSGSRTSGPINRAINKLPLQSN